MRTPLATLVAVLLSVSAASGQPNWPQWRGPSLNGVAEASDLPTTWSTTENVVWKTPLPSWSGGTPVIWGDHIFLTSPSKSEPKPAGEVSGRSDDQRSGRRGGRRGGGRDAGGDDLLLLCVSRTDGTVRWERKLDSGNRLFRKGNNTSPSPVTDGTHVWAVAGTGEVVAFTMDGVEKWRFNLQEKYGEFGLNWGYASSPMLYDGKLIVEVLHGMRTDDPSYVIAFDAGTGAIAWRQERPTDAPMESPDAYTTPVLLERDGATEIVITGGDYVTGHDPATGEEIWRVGGLNPGASRMFRIVASPVAVDGMIYAPTRNRPLLALSASGAAATPPVVTWKWDERGGPDVPTPVCDGELFYMVDDAGMATCLDAKTGEVHWGPERTVSGTVSSSPILADGKIYFTNEESITVVLKAGRKFEVLAANELDGTYTLSSPVTDGKHLFVRTSSHLYCIGNDR